MQRIAKRLLIVLFLAGAAGGGYYAWRTQQASGDPDSVTLYGNVELRDVHLAFTEQEHIAHIQVEEGDRVRPGQVVARLENDRLANELAEARARLAAQREVLRRLTNGTRPQEIDQIEAQIQAAQARLTHAKRRVERLTRTAEQGATTEQDLDDAVADRDVARAELQRLRDALDLAREGFRQEAIAEANATLKARAARVALLQTRMADTVLHAPAEGIVHSRILEVGEMVMPSKPVVVISLTEPKWIRAYLPEPALGKVKPGMPARITSDSFAERRFEGRVGFISPQAEFTPKNVQTTDLRTQLVYEVRIWVADQANDLRLGMPVTVTIDTRQTVDPEQPPSRPAPAVQGKVGS